MYICVTVSMLLDDLMFMMSIMNHRQVDCVLSLKKLLICFNQLWYVSILNLESEVIDFIIQYCDGILKTCCDSISEVNAGVAEVLMQCQLVGRSVSQSVSQSVIVVVLLYRSFIIDTTKS